MAAEIIPFETREARQLKALDKACEQQNADVLTARELYDTLIVDSYESLDALITRYKQTGKWNTEANRLMRQAFDSITAVCAAIAGVNNGTTAQIENVGHEPITLRVNHGKP